MTIYWHVVNEHKSLSDYTYIKQIQIGKYKNIPYQG